ncbi:MAG: two-component system, cell cycle sensor histidine kinase and response regulator CckA, partial [Bryobacterales bacterium]|nr:two-component system, cell cycle sensor histidine kinase and response regulator CckA [Bryobacterales bacterium]
MAGSQRFEESMAALAAQVAAKPMADGQSGGASPISIAVSEEARPPRKKLKAASPAPTATLLILDDDEDQIKLLCKTMGPTGYAATCFTSAEAALGALREQPFDLVLTDLVMPGMDGIAFLRAAREIEPDLVGILMTAQDIADSTLQAMRASVQDLLIKPFSISAVLPVLERALNVRRLRQENVHLQQAVGIYELSMVIRLTLDFEAVLQKLADAAMAHAQVRSVSMLLPTHDGSALRVAVSRGEHAERDLGKRIPFSQALAHWVQRSLKRVSRLNELADLEPPSLITFLQLPDSVSIPMLAGGTLVGILNFTPKNPGRQISPTQIKALNILAGAGATALTSASLFDQMRSAEARYRSLAESAGDIIFRYELHPGTHLEYVNPAVTSIIGYSPAQLYAGPELLQKIIHPDDHQLYEKILAGGFSSGSTVSFRCIHRNGSTVWLEQRSNLVRDPEGRLIAVEGIARDITERRLLEDQLRQSQKMEAMGLLAAGVAHDFNNLLTVILGYSDLILSDDKPAAGIAEKLAQVKRAAEQAGALTRQLLTFGRSQLIELKILNLNSVVANSSKILRRTIGEDIAVIINPQTTLGNIKADAAQVEQILMNLAVNARSAMPQGGEITIETRNVTVEESCTAEFLAGHPGPHVMLALSDTGCGMEAATMARMFEPFYTTKELGQGTG